MAWVRLQNLKNSSSKVSSGDHLALKLDDLDTPALIVDLDLLESNIGKMGKYTREVGCNIRPHIKVHKTPAIAHMQIESGAIGVTCAKLGEAEVMASAGIRNILIANQIVGRQKTERLAGLARHAEVIVAVDNPENAEEISKVASTSGAKIGAVVEVDVGMKRAGVQPDNEVISLARKIKSLPSLDFQGLMGYEGHLQLIPKYEERKKLVEKSLGKLIECVELLRGEGIECPVVSGAGTNTYNIASGIKGITEIEAGSYTVMDNLHSVEGIGFERALSVLSTITSRPEVNRAVIDAGLKAFADATPFPTSKKNERGMRFVELSEEHGHLILDGESPRVGDKLEFFPFYAPTTINLYEKIWGIRDGRVEIAWDVLLSKTEGLVILNTLEDRASAPPPNFDSSYGVIVRKLAPHDCVKKSSVSPGLCALTDMKTFGIEVVIGGVKPELLQFTTCPSR
jgi:D-serine deaminase-like pyridoxal phosphate-dependent protein